MALKAHAIKFLSAKLGVPSEADRTKMSRRVASLEAEVKVLRKRAAYLEEILLNTRRDDHPAINEVQELLVPRPSGHDFVRIGSAHDGGYVFARDVDYSWVLSVGIGSNNEADVEFANQGVHVSAFDHTIDTLPEEHPNITFHRMGIGYGSDSFLTLREMVDISRTSQGDGLLAMDVEGSEWAVLAEDPTALDALKSFSQVSIELHGLHRLAIADTANRITLALRRLTANHVSVALVANNFEPTMAIEGVSVPDTVEVLLIRRDRFVSGSRFPIRQLMARTNPRRLLVDPDPFGVDCWA